MPFVVAHRAGNDLDALRRAETAGVALVEADVHLFRGRLEVRHLKAAGPLLWDKWFVAPPRTPRLSLRELLDAAAPETVLMLDLKGVRRALARRVLAELGGRPVVVCSRSWRLLDVFAAADGVRVVHSVGSPRQLRALLRRGGFTGVSIHQRLLDARTVAALKRHAELVLTWPVVSGEQATRLAAWGVDGLITDDFEPAVAGEAAVAA